MTRGPLARAHSRRLPTPAAARSSVVAEYVPAPPARGTSNHETRWPSSNAGKVTVVVPHLTHGGGGWNSSGEGVPHHQINNNQSIGYRFPNAAALGLFKRFTLLVLRCWGSPCGPEAGRASALPGVAW